MFYFTSPILNLQGDSAEIEDDIGLLCLSDQGVGAESPMNVKAPLVPALPSVGTTAVPGWSD